MRVLRVALVSVIFTHLKICFFSVMSVVSIRGGLLQDQGHMESRPPLALSHQTTDQPCSPLISIG